MSMLEDPTKLSEDEEEESEDQLNMKRYTEARQICMGVGILFFFFFVSHLGFMMLIRLKEVGL